jgi:N-acetylglucosaminyldiphosphoundecaprenol N-acetyl-beta-D-mannosaminyltransferase
MPAVFGIEFSPHDKESLVRDLTRTPVRAGTGLSLVVTANTDHIVNLLRNERFRAAYRSAKVATADGAPVALYARLRGAGVPGRVAGSDVFPAVMGALTAERHRPFFIVSREAAGQRLRQWLGARGFAQTMVGIDCPPFGFELDDEYSARLARQVREHRTTHLFLGVGSPKSEIWLDDWSHALGDCYGLAVGAGIDFFVGTEVRAPAWMQTIGMEWVWRLLREPRRLGRRYLVDGLLFPVAVLRDASGRWQAAERRSSLAAGPADVHRAR